MNVPQRYCRFPTAEAIDSLVARFALRNEPNMQDWEYEVADPDRLAEFLAALERDDLTDDERFTLSEIVMQCFEELSDDTHDVSRMEEWQRFVAMLRARPTLHAFTLCYWSAPDPTHAFAVSPLVRPLWRELEPVVLREIDR